MNTPTQTFRQGIDDESAKRLAVVIDVDNAQASLIEALLEEVARFGEATVRQILGDFTSQASGERDNSPKERISR